MNNLIPSWIRTAVPTAISAVLTWLAARWGILLDEQSQTGLVSGFVALVLAAYYALVRVLELKWPWVGWLLGLAKQPGYRPGTPPPSEPPPVPNE